MRVTGGHSRGRRLKAGKGKRIRPTFARVREAIYDIIPPDLSGCNILDLFAGVGSLGIEALSRGGEKAVFIDQSREAVRIIEENLKHCSLLDKGKVIKFPVSQGLRKLEETKERFDLVLADPPYEKGLVDKILAKLAKSSILENGAVIVMAHSVREIPKGAYPPLLLTHRRVYGTTVVSFYERKD